jgi:hypothetical protein
MVELSELEEIFVNAFKVGARNTEAVVGVPVEGWQSEEALENEARLIFDGCWREKLRPANKM